MVGSACCWKKSGQESVEERQVWFGNGVVEVVDAEVDLDVIFVVSEHWW